MINAIQAEWYKSVRNTWQIGILIYGIPLFTLAVYAIEFMVFLADSAPGLASDQNWLTQMLHLWQSTTQLQAQIIVVLVTASFFAEEYASDTWKGIIPRSTRVHLIFSKVTVLLALLVLSVFIASLMAGVFTVILNTLRELPPGPTLAQALSQGFAGVYLQTALYAVVVWLISILVTASASLLTRSVMVGTMAGIGFVVLDTSLLLALYIVYQTVTTDVLIHLYQLSPGYNLTNIWMWIQTGVGYTPFIEDFAVVSASSLELSLRYMVVWIVGLAAVAQALFRRQNIT